MSEPLNITGKELLNQLGLAYNGQILQEFRDLKLVSFFKIGKKYMYPRENVHNINEKLISGEISIKTNNGYYITLNK